MAYPYQTQGFTLDNSGRRIVVDPVTRIEGHMRCEVNIDSNNVITNAVSTGTMWRGLEVILKGRDPRDAWAFVERICGVCTGTHALTSIRAVENALGIAIPDQLLSVLKLPKEALFSTLGRTAARALESVWAGNTLQYFFDRLMRNLKSGDTATANVTLWEPDTWPTSAKGVGFSEAPRGALGHWIKIENQKIDSYQCVVPTTWNAGPRDDKGQIGAYEAALMGTKLAVPDQPLEILRTLHSFDPCLACSTHVIDNHGGELVRVQVR
ncbi:putative hydrogenase-1 large subunit [Salmonella enterica subsp. enterica serovar Choleraesuis str. 0006]|nr:putative hydrogenase-1 large subunit [Salmonella enterica subsp. enterica serovar Choleraesuis str. 0006]